MKLVIHPITWESTNLNEVWRLYRASFPKEERVRLEDYLNDPIGNVEILGFYENKESHKDEESLEDKSVRKSKADWEEQKETFIGFAIFMTYFDLTHILYFCIEENFRQQGYGSAALDAMREYYPHNRIMADLEDPVPGASNLEERKRRIDFYERNGYTLSNVHYVWEKENYVMMVQGGSLTMEEFEAYWDAANQDRGVGYERMEE